MNKIDLFGREIPLRTHFCQFFEQDPEPVNEPTVSLYVRTKFCNAECDFCIWDKDAQYFNEKKYIEVLEGISSKIKIKKISFTGGEPTMNFDKFKRMVQITKDIVPKTKMSVNTNGLRLKKLFEDDIINNFYSVALSRHHFDDKLNDDIFKFKSPTSQEIIDIQNNFPNKSILHFSCNLIKGFIDDKDKIYQFLEWASSVDVRSVGFVSLMPVNEYSKENFIDFKIKDLINERFNLTKEWNYKNMCKCNNYVYIPESLNNIIKVYQKNTFKPFDIQENLTFDGENLKVGFGDDIIY